MEEKPTYSWTQQSIVRLDRDAPYLRIQHVTIFISDFDRSLDFFVRQLGLQLVLDNKHEGGHRWAAVAPPDGTTILALVKPGPSAVEFPLIGKARQICLITEDIMAKYNEWAALGVRFPHPPTEPVWGGLATSFEDPDGNAFVLMGFDGVSHQIELQRRALLQKLETERRISRDLEIAAQVQSRLFPQTLPELKTLELAGACHQARQVGGDYYDFLNFGGRRLWLALGDIVGKGIAAALMMANLQANLRSQCALLLDDPRRLLESVNQLFHRNTEESGYSTLFLAEYEEERRLLRYVNCGHLPGLLLRRDLSVESLDSTATVIGLFPEWNCRVEERVLLPGDALILYTDGVTESFNEQEEDFGDQRLIESVRRHRELPAAAMLDAIVDDVRAFSPGEQQDDITLIVAKAR
jgi:serine phosphatase RsbU (regulator of sigma subunit)/predicted enzyme related to lactoylglutathione lyase